MINIHAALFIMLSLRAEQYSSKFKFEFTAEKRLVCSAVCFSVFYKLELFSMIYVFFPLSFYISFLKQFTV